MTDTHSIAGAALARVAECVLADPAMAMRLAAIESTASFRDALLACISGLDADDARTLAAVAFDQPVPSGVAVNAWSPVRQPGWQPLALEWSAAGAEILWGCGEVPDTVAFHEQIVATLKQQGTPVWYLVGKDEGHGFQKKKNVDFQFYSTIQFIREYLLK